MYVCIHVSVRVCVYEYMNVYTFSVTSLAHLSVEQREQKAFSQSVGLF